MIDAIINNCSLLGRAKCLTTNEEHQKKQGKPQHDVLLMMWQGDLTRVMMPRGKPASQQRQEQITTASGSFHSQNRKRKEGTVSETNISDDPLLPGGWHCADDLPND